MKYGKIKNKDQEFSLRNELKNKYGLNLIINNKKANVDNEYKVIPINNDDKSDSEEENDVFKNFRGTISYNQSKMKKEKDEEKEKPKIVNIFEVWRKSIK